ncbi:hypothetical protein GCM10025867_32000 [Frondihabitans sucicola]|uniref:Uncharacterized protein n=1 Tax=Frondihabitans sucicola TaxID=1268041 RepID=A0ABM8GRQ2_9MICO|nr:hypothetical protein [Frondihabitans sucicola]BDZ50959.1 hypothetical protein GCM10025867_32000 [Frondihabitans sucicola]
MSVDGRFHDIERADVMAVADRHLVPRASAVVDEVREAVAGWRGYADRAGLTRASADRMAEAMPRW